MRISSVLLGLAVVLATGRAAFAEVLPGQSAPVNLQPFSLALAAPHTPHPTPQSQQVQMIAAQKPTDFPVVKSSGLSPNLNIPWSKPVRVTDPFDGSFLAVFDRHDIRRRDRGYGGSAKVVSLWSRDTVKVLLITQQGQCSAAYSLGFSDYYDLFPYRRFSGLFDSYYEPICVGFNTSRVVRKLLIRVGDQILQVEGENNRFVVNSEVAAALKNAPLQNIDIRMELEGGETVDSEIGKGTVAAWKTVYQ